MANLRAINIYNVTCTSANTEYSQALPPNVRSFAVQPRTAVDVRMAFVTGKVAGSTAPFFTLKAGGAGDLAAILTDTAAIVPPPIVL